MKRNIFILAGMAMMLGLTSCEGSNGTLGTHKVRTLTLSDQGKEICAKQNEFAIDLLKTMSAENDNLFVSPLSAAFVCAMVANGSEGVTKEEILRAIGCEGYSMEALNEHYLNLMENLPYQDATTYIGLANAAWVDNDFPIYPEYADVVRTHYLAEVANMELSDPASAEVLNKWAGKHTKGMVTKICDESYFNDDIRLILANALCFKGQWDEEFKQSNTWEQTFHAPNGDMMVEMMHGYDYGLATGSSLLYRAYGQYHQEEQHARVLRMYYKGKGYCMDIVLPEPEITLDELMPRLSAAWVDSMLHHNVECLPTNVSVPKWKMQARYRLNEPMEALGMKQVFSPLAEVTGISPAASLYLDLLQQDTYIEVDEKGTKAAAVTIGIQAPSSAEPGTPFVVDRPFVFLIRDVKNGIILFAGKVNHPKY